MVYRFLSTLFGKPLKRLKIAAGLLPRLKPWAKLKNKISGYLIDINIYADELRFLLTLMMQIEYELNHFLRITTDYLTLINADLFRR
jgi:hypothetical protein